MRERAVQLAEPVDAGSSTGSASWWSVVNSLRELGQCHSSCNRPVLSPNESAFTPTRSSIARYRFISGVSRGIAQVPAGVQRAAALAGQQDRQVVVVVAVAVADAAAVDDHAVVQQRRAVAFADRPSACSAGRRTAPCGSG